VLDLAAAAGVAGEPARRRMKDLLAAGDPAMKRVRKLAARRTQTAQGSRGLLDEREIRYLPPIPDADKFLCREELRTHLEELKRNDLLTRRRRSRPVSSSSTPAFAATTHESLAEGIVSLDYEPELVFVIGKRALGAKKKDAFDTSPGSRS